MRRRREARAHVALRIARALVGVAAARAPERERARMEAEWTAELSALETRGHRWRTVSFAAGAFADARALRAVERQRNMGRMTMKTWIDEGAGGRLDRWASELRIAARSLVRAPAFAGVSLLTLTVGLGGTAAMFAVVHQVVLSPLPYPAAERMVRLQNRVPGVGPDEVWNVSTAQWVHLEDRSTVLESVGIYRMEGANVMTSQGPVRARIGTVTESVMRMLGAEVEVGRILQPADDRPGATPVALLSHGFWTDRLAADPAVVGTTIEALGATVEIVGVLEPGLGLPGLPPSIQPDLWTPLRIDRAAARFYNSHIYLGIGRLRPGTSTDELDRELATLRAELLERYGFETFSVPLKTAILGDLSRNLWMILAGVGVVLLIGVVNVANLFSVRAEGRRTDIAVRTALGATRRDILRTTVSEALLLSLVGGILAVAAANWLLPALIALAPEGLPRIGEVRLDAWTVGVTLLLSCAVGIGLVGLTAVGTSESGFLQLLRQGAGRGSAGPRSRRFRSGMVAGQMTLALVLLVGSGLLVRSLGSLLDRDLGFDPGGVVLVDVYLDPARYPDDAAIWRFDRALLERVRAHPEVERAGLGEMVPVEGAFACTVQGFEDPEVYARIEAAGRTACAGQARVTPGYFDALGIPIVRGRGLEEADLQDPTRAAVVVSRTFADRFWPGEDPIGKGVGPSGRAESPFFRVVGVAEDVPGSAAAGGAPLSTPAVAVYYPVVDDPTVTGTWYWWPGSKTLVVRTAGPEPSSLVPDLRAILGEVDGSVPLANARVMDDVVAEAAAHLGFVTLLLGIAAGVAVLLAAVGLYGVVSYLVSRRTREIGMRLAVGADPGEVEWMVVRGTLGLCGAGLLAGLPVAYLASGLLEALLYEVTAADPLVYAAAGAGLLGVSAAASWLPARRAAAVDPVLALRAD